MGRPITAPPFPPHGVGVKVMFRVGLVLLRLALGSPEKLRSAQGMFETMELLRSVPPPGLHEDALVHQVGIRGG